MGPVPVAGLPAHVGAHPGGRAGDRLGISSRMTWGGQVYLHSLVVATKSDHHIAMKRAKISELKNELSRYLRYVRKGESVLILDRDRPVARIDPVRSLDSLESADWTAELERAGVLRGPVSELPSDWLARRAPAEPDVVAALLEERETGR